MWVSTASSPLIAVGGSVSRLMRRVLYFTGATITPRAVVRAVRLFLEYFQRQREQLFRAMD